MADYDKEDGVWRTVGGRRIFIRNGQSLSDAMKESGKFKKKDDEKSKKINETMDKRASIIKKLDDDTKDLSSYDKYNLAVSKLENNDYSSPTERQYWAGEIERYKKSQSNDTFEVSDLKKKAMETLPKDHIDTHEGDLYLKKTKESTELLNRMKDKDSGMLSTFRDQQTGEEWYDVPFANMGDDYKEKFTPRAKEKFKNEQTTNDIMNKAIKDKVESKRSKNTDDLPKKTEIKEQGTSNRKEVSENIQAHILEYYDSPDDFVQQMDAMDYLPTRWKAGEELAKGGNYLIYNSDMSDFLDSLKINPKGKKFSEDKAFDMYTSLVGRESAKLYDRLQKNAYKKYMREHPLSKISFSEFQDMNKK